MTPEDDKPLTPAQARQKLQDGLKDYLAGNGSEAIVFRLKRNKKASELYPVKLTQQQRETVLRCTNLARSLKSKFQRAGQGTQIVGFTWNELHKLHDETGQAEYYSLSGDKKRLMAAQRQVLNHIEAEHIELFGPTVSKADSRKGSKATSLFQFKITLIDIRPAIWRRIQITDCTLAALHHYIQASFGWQNCHMHQFEIEKKRYSSPSPYDDDLDFEDESKFNLSKLLPMKTKKKIRWLYEYDFGDGWRHEVLFEGNPPIDPKMKAPICLEGERSCPPEDCGGPWGYDDFLAALSNRKHPRHEEMLEWIGEFDPERFDAKKATKEMRRVKP
ncbi:hypothetical protein BH11PLA2_BH11PLA2_43290 [soil metagenome]